MRVLINTSIGGFGVTKEAFDRLIELGNPAAIEEMAVINDIMSDGSPFDYYSLCYIKRNDSDLMRVVDELGIDNISRRCELKIVEVPDDIDWYIFENECGQESVHEEHRIWY